MPTAPASSLPAQLASRMLDDALDAVLIADSNSRIRYLNGAMQALCGYGGGELLDEPLEGLLPDNLSDHHHAYVLHYLRSTTPSTVLGRVRAFAIRHRNAEMIPVEMKAIDLGVVDGVRYFGAFMVDVRARRAMEEKNAQLLAQLEQQAMTDALTGLPNRRAFSQEAALASARTVRHAAPLTVGVADIDHFKKVNDRYGHAIGDAVLCAVAGALRAVARNTDMAARLGGEEFGLLLPHTTLDQAAQVAERVRAAVAALRVDDGEGIPLSVTISIGLAPLPPAGRLETALSDADKALYRAKHMGRNRVERA